MTWLGTRGWSWKSWKYRMAGLLDKLPWTCWTALVGWVEFGAPLSEARVGAQCRSDLERCGSCYCRKLGDPGLDQLAPLPEDAPF